MYSNLSFCASVSSKDKYTKSIRYPDLLNQHHQCADQPAAKTMRYSLRCAAFSKRYNSKVDIPIPARNNSVLGIALREEAHKRSNSIFLQAYIKTLRICRFSHIQCGWYIGEWCRACRQVLLVSSCKPYELALLYSRWIFVSPAQSSPQHQRTSNVEKNWGPCRFIYKLIKAYNGAKKVFELCYRNWCV